MALLTELGAPSEQRARWRKLRSELGAPSEAQDSFQSLLFLQRFKDVALVVLNLELLEKLEVFLAEGLARMMSHLVPDVLDHALQLRVAIRECAETLLP